jgi:two-component sensor histidine kinase
VGVEGYLSIKAVAHDKIHIGFYKYLAWQVSNWSAWAVFTPVVVWHVRRVPLAARWPPIASHVLLSLLIVLLMALGLVCSERLFNPSGSINPRPFLQSYPLTLSTWGPIDMLLYWAVVVCTYAYDSRTQLVARDLQTARMEGQLNQARIENLHIRLQPHFLFNTLHAVAGLVREGNSLGAITMIAGLSDLLRASLNTVDQPTVSLAEELEMLKRYLEIQQTRFADRLTVDWRIDSQVLNAAIPSLLLQPLAENAIKHGLERAGHGIIRIRASQDNCRLVIAISNDGPPLSPEWSNQQGFGLKATRDRLATLYGDAGSLILENGTGGGVVAMVHLPYQVSPPKVLMS